MRAPELSLRSWNVSLTLTLTGALWAGKPLASPLQRTALQGGLATQNDCPARIGAEIALPLWSVLVRKCVGGSDIFSFGNCLP